MLKNMFSRGSEAPLLKRIAPRFNKKLTWIIVVFIVLAASGGFAYYKLAYLPSQTTTTTAIMQTATVRQGDLVIYASGTGTLVASDEVSLGFKTGGEIIQILFNVGDTVQA